MKTCAPVLLGMFLALAASPSTAHADVNVALFGKDALVQEPAVVDCALTSGEPAKCVKLVVKYKLDNLAIGPFCPPTLDETGGIWSWDGEKPGLYRLNRAFFEMLKGVGYVFYGEDGKIHIADPGAGRPAHDHACLEAARAPDVQMTLLIPNAPKKAASPTNLGTVASVGVGLDGVPIFADAPSVLHTGHLRALDNCAGHIDPGGWYHWHGPATDIHSVFSDINSMQAVVLHSHRALNSDTPLMAMRCMVLRNLMVRSRPILMHAAATMGLRQPIRQVNFTIAQPLTFPTCRIV